MRKEALSNRFQLTLTEHEKDLLERLSYEQGATMRGYLRKLIRDAAALRPGSEGERVARYAATR